MPQWLFLITTCLLGCALISLWLGGSSNNFHFVGVDLQKIALILIFLGTLPILSMGVYDIVRQWHKFWMSVKAVLAILTLLIVTIILTVVDHNQVITAWIGLCLFGLLFIAFGWVFLDVMRELVRRLLKPPT